MIKKGHIISAQKDRYQVVLEENGRMLYCTGKGAFRDKHLSPMVGDFVDVEIGQEDGVIVKLYPRKNQLLRPPVANVDQVLLVQTIVEPDMNVLSLDRILIVMEKRKLPILLCFNKMDRVESDRLDMWKRLYESLGYKIFAVNSLTGQGLDSLRKEMQGKITAIAGPSGAGKSTLIRYLSKNDQVVIGDLSKKISRGKQTTRTVTLFTLDKDSYIFDTPGFSSLDLRDIDDIQDLQEAFPEIRKYKHLCKFRDCSHRKEPDCQVRKALEEGLIAKSRYNSYLTFFNEIQERKKY